MFLSLNLKHFETYSDTAMFPLFDNVLNDTADNKFIVLHMWGAHPYVCDRTNGKYDEFIKSKEISCYNKIIKDLDAFLEHVYTALANKHESFCLIYFSDHGLMIKPDFSLTHRSASVKQSFQVPLLIWSSELDMSMQINAIRTGKDFLHLFTELLNVKTANVERQYKFVSEEKNDDKKLEVFTHGAAAYYDSLPDNSNDIIFDK